jgi:hypothetical protein
MTVLTERQREELLQAFGRGRRKRSEAEIDAELALYARSSGGNSTVARGETTQDKNEKLSQLQADLAELQRTTRELQALLADRQIREQHLREEIHRLSPGQRTQPQPPSRYREEETPRLYETRYLADAELTVREK